MKILRISPLILLLFTFFQQAFADPGRITSPADPAARCTNKLRDKATCDKARNRAVKIGCITEGEKKALERYNSYPTCDTFFEGLEQLTAWCPCGCVHPDTMMSVVDKFAHSSLQLTAEEVAYDRFAYDLVTLDSYEAGKVNLTTQSIDLSTVGPALKNLVVIRTSNDKTLKLTTTHPVLLYDGRVKAAEDLVIGDALVSIEGEMVKVTSLQSLQYEGNVYNFATSASMDDAHGHFVFGEEIAIGDLTLEAMLNEFKASFNLRR